MGDLHGLSHINVYAPLLFTACTVYIGMTKALLLLALLLGACASPPATFSAQAGLEDATRVAVEGWAKALPCDIHVEYVTSDAEVTVEWRALPDKGDVDVLGEGGIRGDEFLEWGSFESWVYVDPETTPEKLYATVAHELGHALRAPHSTNERDLMYSKYSPDMPSTPNARDGKAVCDAWGY